MPISYTWDRKVLEKWIIFEKNSYSAAIYVILDESSHCVHSSKECKILSFNNINQISHQKILLLVSTNKWWCIMMPRLFCQVSNWIVESTYITLLKLQHQPVADARQYILNGSIFHFSISFQWRFSMIYNKLYSFFGESVCMKVCWKVCVTVFVSTFDIIALWKAKWLVRNRKHYYHKIFSLRYENINSRVLIVNQFFAMSVSLEIKILEEWNEVYIILNVE